MFKGGLGDILQQAAKFREDMRQMQETLAKRTVEASAGAGMVKVIATGKQEILSVTIDPELLQKNDRAMLQDLVTAGVNEAIRASQALASQEMAKITEALGPIASMLKGFGG
jgi:DNA-binding YbaB/EbfC family protein